MKIKKRNENEIAQYLACSLLNITKLINRKYTLCIEYMFLGLSFGSQYFDGINWLAFTFTGTIN